MYVLDIYNNINFLNDHHILLVHASDVKTHESYLVSDNSIFYLSFECYSIYTLCYAYLGYTISWKNR